jgi:hypothetical protein
MMKRLELGHEEELGLYNVPKNSQGFFASVDAPCMCKFDHSFLLHPKSKCPLFSPPKSYECILPIFQILNSMKNGKVKFF